MTASPEAGPVEGEAETAAAPRRRVAAERAFTAPTTDEVQPVPTGEAKAAVPAVEGVEDVKPVEKAAPKGEAVASKGEIAAQPKADAVALPKGEAAPPSPPVAKGEAASQPVSPKAEAATPPAPKAEAVDKSQAPQTAPAQEAAAPRSAAPSPEVKQGQPVAEKVQETAPPKAEAAPPARPESQPRETAPPVDAAPKPAQNLAAKPEMAKPEIQAKPDQPEVTQAPEVREPRLASRPPQETPQPAQAAPPAPAVTMAKEEGKEEVRPLEGFAAPASSREPMALSVTRIDPAQAPAASERLATHVSGQISAAISRKEGDRVEIRLDPPELGRVTLSMVVRDDRLVAHVSAERQDIVDLMRRHAEILQKDLNSAGYRNVTLDFAQQEQGQAQGQGGQGQGQSEPAPPPLFSPRIDTVAIAPVNRLVGDDRLDIRL